LRGYGRRGDVHLCAFDLLELDGRDLRLEPLVERRRLLAKLIRKPLCGLVLNEQFDHDGALVFEHACLLGCEGIVSKRKDSRYRSGRSHHWVKIKNPSGTSRYARDRRGLGQAAVAVKRTNHIHATLRDLTVIAIIAAASFVLAISTDNDVITPIFAVESLMALLIAIRIASARP
jgi:ATP dependent DNA ligase-like protein